MRCSVEAGYPPYDRLKPVVRNLWIVDAAPIRTFGITLPVRMTVIRLPTGELWLHSPTRYDDGLLAELRAEGPIRHLVAPSVGHWTFLRAWQERCPDATVWAEPGLRRRLQVRASGLRIDEDLGATAPAAWPGLSQTLIRGRGYREAAFLHEPSRTLILTDLVASLERDRLPSASRIYARLSGVAAPAASTPRYLRVPLRLNRPEVAPALSRLLDWAPERVIFAHGRWFEADGAARLSSSLAWFGRTPERPG